MRDGIDCACYAKSASDCACDDADWSDIYTKINRWFIDRGLDKADPRAQMLKLMEEFGELAADLAKNRDPKDSLGDIGVVLIGLCTQLGTTLEEVLEVAYEEIKDRKGKLVNGVFIKETDL
jgi:NTP pyrophosphatase (non-canonical NTP hydrolase)